MRTFSGRVPRPNGEVDYDTWRIQADLLLSDTSLNDAHKVRKILESLLSPAVDVVKPLGISSPPSAYVKQLDSAFGIVEDGEELFAAFLSSNQNNGEKPSAYLNRLHNLLTRAISRGGASAEHSNNQLLRQFCRGCWDHSIIISLQLENKKSNPPSFPDFLLMLRTEEDRRSAKLDRMKKHLGTTKATTHAHYISDMPSYDGEPVPSPNTKQNEASKLEKKVNELTRQVEKLSKKSENPTHNSMPSPVPKPKQDETPKLENMIAELTKRVEKLTQNQKESENTQKKDCLATSTSGMKRPFRAPGMPRAWFCFKCGEDNHIAAHCSNEPNPTLVRRKNAELRERQDMFLAQQAASPFTLNL
ncbi:zinc finger CCHC domain-containing protein 12-like [Scomber scombrus]|uniref:zinc finger CCHC domain-containing protein 12-like n=1 Tax=Scomber scombrus TaxID=13677 RepID=UPI002DD9FAEE|nr:zinc finger CCHC domain-containing protein 12-like [Scomber scombrus]